MSVAKNDWRLQGQEKIIMVKNVIVLIWQKDKVGQESFFDRSFTTPNRLFKDSKKMSNASVIKDPGKK